MKIIQREAVLFPVSSTSAIEVRNPGREVIDLPTHSHPYHQIIHTVSGTLRIRVGERDYFVPERHLAWIPLGVEHLLSSNNRNISLRVIYCNLPEEEHESFKVLRSDPLIEETLKFIGGNRPKIYREESPELYNYYTAFLQLLRRDGKEYETRLKGIQIPEDSRMKKILSYINDHLEGELNISSICEIFGFSERNLSRLFQKSGLRFTDYVNYQRITRAIELLTEGDRSIQEVAFEVGYNSPNHFNRVFKQILGMTPHDYLRPIEQGYYKSISGGNSIEFTDIKNHKK